MPHGLLFIVGGIGTCRKLSSSKASPPRNEVVASARAVRVITAQNGPVRLSIPITGRLRATDRMLINAEVGGTLQRTGRTFREGFTIRQGEVLFRIDNSEVRAQLNAQQSAFLRTLVQLLPDLRIDLPDAAPKWDAYLKSVPVEGQLPDLPTLASEQERNYLAGRGVLGAQCHPVDADVGDDGAVSGTGVHAVRQVGQRQSGDAAGPQDTGHCWSPPPLPPSRLVTLPRDSPQMGQVACSVSGGPGSGESGTFSRCISQPAMLWNSGAAE
jgi:hypothetical protein